MRGKYSPGYSTDVGWEELRERLKHMCGDEVVKNRMVGWRSLGCHGYDGDEGEEGVKLDLKICKKKKLGLTSVKSSNILIFKMEFIGKRYP